MAKRPSTHASSASEPAKKKPKLGSDSSHAPVEGGCRTSTLTDGADALAISDADPNEALEERDIEPSNMTDELYQVASDSCPVNENEEVVITAIRATNVALSLRRLPAGFYVVLRCDGLEWKTENKASSVNDDVVEWNRPIPISLGMSATICLEVYASFEFQPMLGRGEQLSSLTATVKQLLERSEMGSPFTFLPRDEDIVSSYSSVFVTVRQKKRKDASLSISKVLGPHWSTPESRSELEDATDEGHSALLQYQKHGKRPDLERCVQQFKRALDICPLDHPCRAAVQSNLAMAELIRGRVEGTNTPYAIALPLYRAALAARPAGHPDRPSTLIQLAGLYLYLVQLQQRSDHAESTVQISGPLQEVMSLSCDNSHERRAAMFVWQLHIKQLDDFSPVRQDPTPHATADERMMMFGVKLLELYERSASGHLAYLDLAIATFEKAAQSSCNFAAVGNLCAALSYRFDHTGRRTDLDDAISHNRDTADRIPHGHPDRSTHLNHLGTSLFTRFQRFGELTDLEGAISAFTSAVDITRDHHPDKPIASYLNNLGTSLFACFERLGKLSDLQAAISKQKEAVDLTPHGHPDQPVCLQNLGTSLAARFKRLRQISDLENAIWTHKNAVNLIPLNHRDRRNCLYALGTSLITRFEHLGELDDLKDAISTIKDAVDLAPQGYPDQPAYLSALGASYRSRFHRLDQLSDLNDAISFLAKAVDLTPSDHPDKPYHLNNLGVSLKARFDRLGELNDLEDAISHMRVAADYTPQDHPGKPSYLKNLGVCFFARFQRLGDISHLQDAISTLRNAVALNPPGHSDHPVYLDVLGTFLTARFRHLGQFGDLKDAIEVLKDAVNVTPNSHIDLPRRLNSLANAYLTGFQRFDELSHLEDAISMLSDAVDLTPHDHPERPRLLRDLGYSLKTRFQRLGKLADMEDAILRLRDAVDPTPDDHPGKPSLLNNLGTVVLARFQRVGGLSDLEDAISTQRNAVDLTPHGHPDKPSHLNSLGNSFLTRFSRLGELSDLEDAISTQRNAVDLTPHGHPDKPSHLNSLGNSFLTRFSRLGELNDLEDAISTQRNAVDLTPQDHPKKPGLLNNLGTSLKTRFEHLGELSDLEDALSSQRNAVDLTPHGHPDKPNRLNNLGNSLLTRFSRLGELNDLEDAISTQRNAVDLTPHGHPDKPNCLNNLGNSFLTRFERLGKLSDLEDAISTQRNAVDLTPHGHPDKPTFLNNLGNSLKTRFKRLGELSDFKDAISTQRDAVDLTPHSHPDMPLFLTNLGRSFTSCYERLGDSEISNLEQAISIFSHAASSPVGPVNHRFRASQEWISCARRISHPSLLHAYSVALTLIPQFAWIGLSLAGRYQRLSEASDIVREAVAAALDAGFPEAGIEWLEQGRSVVWGELFQLRSSYEELSTAYPEHAHRLRKLSADLDQATAAHEMLSESEQASPSVPQAIESSRQVADKQRRLAIERDELLRKIRRLPGFEQFLRPKRFSQHRASVNAGPVVILNAAETRCDALIVLADLDHVIHVPLTRFTYQKTIGLQSIMKDFVRGPRAGSKATIPGINWESILSSLWTDVVKPVLDALAFSEPRDLSRIFWCPTGPFTFLPIHAAGLYGTQYSQSGHKLSDFHISSYVPTLSILALSPEPNPCTTPINDFRLLAVRQPPSDGFPPLSGVGPELEHIRNVIRKSPAAQTILVEPSQGNVEEVLALMKGADWAHFACHGIQDAADPTKSGLCLANGRRLALRDIISLHRPRGGLAFLSACETAKGDRRLSDEAIHIAAGMLFAGYGGVIGTMWSISDRFAPEVAKVVYEYLFRDGKRPDYREAARALHEAVGRARQDGTSFNNWIPFIHLGL